MGYAEKRCDSKGRTYYLARFADGRGKWPSVKDPAGRALRYKRKLDAERAADDEEAKVRGGQYHDPAAGQIAFEAWVNEWYATQNLAPSTMQNYRHHLEEHLLPAFAGRALADIDSPDVDAWERAEREAGYKPSSIKTWRGTLHLVLADAVEAKLITANPATKRRGRGRRAGRHTSRGPEKVITGPLGALLIAERAALLSGRDDEFVLVITKYFTGMRWAELIGLETRYARLGSIRVEQQLWEDDNGVFHILPPKDDSYRDIDLPPFASTLISGHIARTAPQPCECHDRAFVFAGRGRTGPDGTGRVRTGPVAAHWRRSGFDTWVFTPAADAWYPKKAPQVRRPVPLLADPWPGLPVRGRNSAGRAEACWTPIATGLTPHGLRHSHKTLLNELRTDTKLKDERLGHLDGSVQARYSHVTEAMRKELCDGLTERWEAALDARLRMCPTSPVAVLKDLLRARQHEMEKGRSEDRPTEFPQKNVSVLRPRPRKRA